MNEENLLAIADARCGQDDLPSEPLDAIESNAGRGEEDTLGRLGTPECVLLDKAAAARDAHVSMEPWEARVRNPSLAAAYALWWRAEQRRHMSEQRVDGSIHILPDCRCCGMGTGSFCEQCNLPLCTLCCEAFDECCFACMNNK